jgi:hypothetical protein
MTATGEVDTLSRRYVFLKPYRAPRIGLYLLHLLLHIAPKLVAIFAVIEIRVTKPEDNGADN